MTPSQVFRQYRLRLPYDVSRAGMTGRKWDSAWNFVRAIAATLHAAQRLAEPIEGKKARRETKPLNLHAGKFRFFEVYADAMELRNFARKQKSQIAMTLYKEGSQPVALLFVAGAENIRRIQEAFGDELVVAGSHAK
jgi:hypothetical protein